MSLWGNRDSFSLTGTTIDVTAASTTVSGSGTLFTTELQEGKTVTISNVKYKIFKIISNTELTLVVPFAGSTNHSLAISNVKGTDIPKYIHQQDLQHVFFLDQVEAQQEENIAKGLNEPGWWFYKTYTDAQGQVRNKSEHLVAFSVLPSVSGDAEDDATVVDGTITITSSGSNRTIAAGASTTFTVAATLVGGTTLSYLWYADNNTGYGFRPFTVDNEPVFTGWNTATLTASIPVGESATYTGWKFQCVVSSDGCTSKTSTYKTLTVTA